MTTTQNQLSEAVFTRLSEIMAGEVDVHRCAAASALGRIAHDDSGAVLSKALLDEDEDVRVDTIAALAQLADPATADVVLESFVGDPCPEVKLAAIEVLTKLRHKPIVAHLLKLVVDRDDEIAWDEDEFYQGGWDDWLDIQLAAIKSLGEFGIKEAVPLIVTALDDDMGQDISHTAIAALVKIGASALAALTDIYDRGDARMRRRICGELQPGQTRAIGALFDRCLEDEDAQVRGVAVEKLLGFSREDARLEGFFTDVDSQIRAKVVGEIGHLYPASVIDRLRDKSDQVRQAAFQSIAANPDKFEKKGFSDIAVKGIAGSAQVAGDAAIAWATMVGEPSAESLGKALSDTNQPLPFRLGLVKALEILGEAGYTWLTRAAGDENRQVRIDALTSLGQFAENTAWPNGSGDTLLAALNGELVVPPSDDTAQDDQDEIVIDDDDKHDAANNNDTVNSVKVDEHETEEIQHHDATPKLATSTLDQLLNHGIQTEAAIDENYQAEEIVLDERDRRFIKLSKQRAMRKQKISLDVKIAPHQDVRRFSARLLAQLAKPGVVEALVGALDSDDEELKLAVLDSLSCLGQLSGELPSVAGPAILNETANNKDDIRCMALRCLAWIDGQEIIDALTGLISDENVHIRQEAVFSLGKHNERGDYSEIRPNLVSALEDNYSGVRMTAARALVAARDTDTVRQLVKLSLAYDGIHRGDSVKLLSELDSFQATQLYLKVLHDNDSKRVWRLAMEALGELLARPNEKNISLAA